MSKALEVNDGNFDDEVLKSDLPVLVDFWAPWCIPCKTISPIIDEIAGEFDGKIKTVKINVDENKQAAGNFGVRSIPNLMIFKSGEKFSQKVGVKSKQELVEEIERALV